MSAAPYLYSPDDPHPALIFAAAAALFVLETLANLVLLAWVAFESARHYLGGS